MQKLIIFFALFVGVLSSMSEVAIIPRPLELNFQKGHFSVNQRTVIYTNKAFRSEAIFFAKAILTSTGIKLKVKAGKGRGINFSKDESQSEIKEAYRLKVSPKSIVVKASDKAGAFYAVQSLLQTLPAEVISGKDYSGDLHIPAMIIKDSPRFSWRSFMLDEGRYFKGKKEVKRLLDQMAQLKMNVFHWHLTEDQGWRIEIKKYPKLTSVGSKRKDTQVGGWGSARRSGVPHEGFYTQEEIKEIVRYAKRRHIMIVPEIGMPGHASAAVAAYPELGTVREPMEVPVVFGKLPSAYNAASEKVYKMLSDILDEVVALFPGSVIHIGGDEVKFDQWKNSSEIKALMEREGLKTVSDVQIYFTNRMSKIIAKKNRRMMGWNEIMGDDLHGFLKGGQTATQALDKSAVIHFWKGGNALAKKAIEKGHDVINSTHNYTYLDYGYGTISLQRAYAFDPIFQGLDPKYHHKVKGFGCQMWGEWIPTVNDMHRQVFPRLASYGEVGWTALERKSYSDFKRRMREQAKRWDLVGINYAKNIIGKVTADDFFNYQKLGDWSPESLKKTSFSLKIKSEVSQSGPVKVALLYKKGKHALEIKSVALYQNGKKISEDRHDGFSGGSLKNILYKLHLKKYKKSAKYSLKIEFKGSGGTDSYGEVKISQ